jgi:translation initiation factor 3 subunit C
MNESDDSDTESQSSTASSVQAPTKTAAKQVYYSSEDEEPTQRRVIGERDKRHSDMRKLVDTWNHQLNIKDFSKSMSKFDELKTAIEKAKKALEEDSGKLPVFVLAAFMKCEDTVNEAWPTRKKLNKMQSQELTKLRQRIKKYREEKPDFSEQFDVYRENPVVEEAEPEEEPESEDDDSVDVAPVNAEEFLKKASGKGKGNKFGPIGANLDSDAEDEDESESESEEESESESDSGESADSESESESESEDEDDTEESEDEADDESDGSSVDWGSDSDESGDEDDIEYSAGDWKLFLKDTQEQIDARKALEKAKVEKEKKEKLEERKRKKEKREQELKKEIKESGEWTTIDKSTGTEFVEIFGTGEVQVKMFEKSKEKDLKDKHILDKHKAIIDTRGKKNYHRQFVLLQLNELLRISTENKMTCATEVILRFSKISTLLEFSMEFKNTLDADQWIEMLAELRAIIKLCENNKNLIVNIDVTEDEEHPVLVTNAKGNPEWKCDPEETFYVRKSLIATMQNMDQEYNKKFQNTDQHSTTYAILLGNEPEMVNIIRELCNYQKTVHARTEAIYNTTKKEVEAVKPANEEEKDEADKKIEAKRLVKQTETENLAKAYLLLIEHLYYRYNPMSEINDELKQMYYFIYKNELDGENLIKTKMVLYQIYHLALHDHWYEAHDLLLMSHMQQAIDNANIETRIIYNRALVQLGLCAFRHGRMRDAHAALVDIQSSNRAKELLAQGLIINKNQERTPEEEREQKRRQMPFHMNINLELLEGAYLVSAMLNEVPYLAQHEFDSKRRMISKQFHHILRMAERNNLNAPPENMRDHLVAASKFMKLGDWRKCVGYVLNEKLQKLIWSRFPKSEEVVEMLRQKIKEESLRTYLFTYSQFYTNISKEWLAENFELDPKIVTSIVTKMVLNDNLSASWDGPSQSLVMHGTEPTRLQNIALQLTQKIQQISEANERITQEQAGNKMYSNYRNNNWQGNNNYKGKGDNRGGKGGGYKGKGGDNPNYKGKNNRNGEEGGENKGGYKGNNPHNKGEYKNKGDYNNKGDRRNNDQNNSNNSESKPYNRDVSRNVHFERKPVNE